MVKSAQAEKELGDSNYRLGHYSEAIDHYSTALKMMQEGTAAAAACSFDEATLHANRAMCYLSIKQYVLALMDCNAALSRNPDYSLLFEFIFCLLFFVITVVLTTVKALIRKATALEKLKRYREARDCLQSATEKDEEFQYKPVIEKISIRVDFFLALEEATDIWGEAPDSFTKIIQAFDTSKNELVKKHKPAVVQQPQPNPTPGTSTNPAPPSSSSVRSTPSDDQNEPRKKRKFGDFFHNILNIFSPD